MADGAKIVALANQKGGVGKTTTAINLAASVSLLGKKVLVVDSDPQGNTSSGLGVSRANGGTHLYHCYMGEAETAEVVQPAPELKKLYVLPTHIDLIGVEVELMTAVKRERYLANVLSPVRGDYDYIFIDCPPSLGLLTINALTAADTVLIPLQCEYFALEGLSQLVRTIRLVKNSYNRALAIEGLLLTMYDGRNKLTHQVVTEVKIISKAGCMIPLFHGMFASARPQAMGRRRLFTTSVQPGRSAIYSLGKSSCASKRRFRQREKQNHD